MIMNNRNTIQILNSRGTPLRSRHLQKRNQRNAYEGASNNNTNFHYWKDAHGQDFNSALAGDKPTLVARIQHENRNNSFFKGIARKYANFIVGEGPIPKIICEDDADWGAEAERRFKRWSNNCNYKRPHMFNKNIRGGSLTGIIRLGVMQLFDHGEYLIIQQNDPTEKSHNKMKLLVVDPKRLRPQDGAIISGGISLSNGIEYDKKGRPIRYWIADRNENELFADTFGEFTIMPAQMVVHDWVEESANQTRGEPWMAQALATGAKLRHFQQSTLSAAEMQSLFASFLTCTNPELIGQLVKQTGGEFILPEFKEDLEPGTLTTAPPGFELQNTSPTHPNTGYEEFVKENKSEASSGACDMPLSVAESDTSRSNFASGKIDRQDFSVNLDAMRFNNLEEKNINRVFDMWLEEEMLVPLGKGGLREPKNDCKWTLEWIWRRRPNHLDDQKKANARNTNLQNFVETLPDIWMEDHKDPEVMKTKVIEQKEWMDKHGLTFKDVISVNETITTEAGSGNGKA